MSNYARPEWRIADRIRRARIYADLEQTELAEKCGVSRGLISQWELDRQSPRVDELDLVAKATGVDLAWLAGALGDGVC